MNKTLILWSGVFILLSCTTPKYCTGVVESESTKLLDERPNANTVHFYTVKTDSNEICVRSFHIYASGDTLAYRVK